MPNTVHGPYTATAWADGVTAANQTHMNNLETQAAIALHGFNPLLFTPFIYSGCAASRHNAYAATVLADSPLNYFRCDDTSGTVAVNLGSSGVYGTYTGTVTFNVVGALTGDPDTAVTFAAANSNRLQPNVYPTGGNAAFTVEFWFKVASNPGSTQGLYVNGNPTATNLQDVRINYTTTGTITVDVGGSVLITSAALTTATWHYVALRYDGAGTLTLNIDNAAAQTASSIGTLAIPTNGSHGFGVSINGTLFFSGSMDECAEYNAKLADARITAHYTNGTTATTTVDIASGTAFITLSDGTVGQVDVVSTTQTTVTINTTYYLYLQPDGTWYWSTSNSPAANSLAIATVTTDGSGNVKLVTDTRVTKTTLLSTQAGGVSAMLGTVLEVNGQATAGSFGVPVIVAQALDTNVTTTSPTTILSYTAVATGLYRLSGSFKCGNVSPSITIAPSFTSHGVTNSGQDLYSLATQLAAATGFGSTPRFINPESFSADAGTAITVQYTNTGASPNDYVSMVLERLG